MQTEFSTIARSYSFFGSHHLVVMDPLVSLSSLQDLSQSHPLHEKKEIIHIHIQWVLGHFLHLNYVHLLASSPGPLVRREKKGVEKRGPGIHCMRMLCIQENLVLEYLRNPLYIIPSLVAW